MSLHSTHKEKKCSRKLIVILLVITFFVLIIRTIAFVKEKKEKQLYNDALKNFESVCNYVVNNEQAFKTLSSYEISIFDETVGYSDIKIFGEHQQDRNTVFSCVQEGRVAQGNENVIAEYTVYSLDPYFIKIKYCSEPIFDVVHTETKQNINENTQIALYKKRTHE